MQQSNRVTMYTGAGRIIFKCGCVQDMQSIYNFTTRKVSIQFHRFITKANEETDGGVCERFKRIYSSFTSNRLIYNYMGIINFTKHINTVQI